MTKVTDIIDANGQWDLNLIDEDDENGEWTIRVSLPHVVHSPSSSSSFYGNDKSEDIIDASGQWDLTPIDEDYEDVKLIDMIFNASIKSKSLGWCCSIANHKMIASTPQAMATVGRTRCRRRNTTKRMPTGSSKSNSYYLQS
ncbi:hypothetical protein RHGRI_016397 [Rhododendron griersonianum]|uniref:Uncharacterized protein n=1 Tax=Rhododendron griersonianum TaxID=479676 RepID=A0AAV6JTZ9_9ERIC|nr:hypothetical protein RHGRI_016397 [Rhododendron griersonianum]